MRKLLLAVVAALALSFGFGVAAPTPAEAYWIRICVKWSYHLQLVNVGGVWVYKWVRGPCLQWKRIWIPDRQIVWPWPFPFPIPFPGPGPDPGPLFTDIPQPPAPPPPQVLPRR